MPLLPAAMDKICKDSADMYNSTLHCRPFFRHAKKDNKDNFFW
jgi:hypothetical protein